MSETQFKNPPGFDLDLEVLRTFERGLDPRVPERSAIPARVLGYGEISTVFSIQVEGLENLAFKRLPIFHDTEEMTVYLNKHDEYNHLLEDEIGICMAPHGYASFITDRGRPILYLIQHRMPSESIGNRAIHRLPQDQVDKLFHHLLSQLSKLWAYNRRQGKFQVAVDAQFSNWSIREFDSETSSLPDQPTLIYLDTSTPMFRIDGVEQLDAELFLRAAPSFMRWILRWLFLKDVLTRYYDLHLLIVDTIANFYREQHPEFIPDLVRAANEFLSSDAAPPDIKPVTEKEVYDYYQEDKVIWATYLWMRRFDRFLHTRILRRDYPYILPNITKR